MTAPSIFSAGKATVLDPLVRAIGEDKIPAACGTGVSTIHSVLYQGTEGMLLSINEFSDRITALQHYSRDDRITALQQRFLEKDLLVVDEIPIPMIENITLGLKHRQD